MTIEQQMRAAGFKVRITPKTTITDGINAARTVFSKCWFDAEKCADGLEVLRHYRYALEIDAVTRKREPLHDWASHGSDALRYMAVSLQDAKPRAARPPPPRQHHERGSAAWMGA
jgi:phage terminase large subunit